MNNVDYLNENTFLIPYYKQFIKLLENNKILLYGNINECDLEYLKTSNIEVVDDKSDILVAGIVLNNYLALNKNIDLNELIKDITKRLDEAGIILVINNKQMIDETTLNYLFKENYEEVEELIGDDKWNFILYQKRTTK